MSMLKPQDVLVVLKLFCVQDEEGDLGFAGLGKSIGISLGAAHNAVAHLLSAGLATEAPDGRAIVQRKRLFDFLVHGVPRAYYPIKGGMARGVPTSVWGPPLIEKFGVSGEVPVVWPLANGKIQGVTLEPIYKTAPQAAAADARLYDLLTLLDAVRVGRAKERKAAVELLEKAILVDSKGKKLEEAQP